MRYKKCKATRKINGKSFRCCLPQNHAGLHEYVESYNKYRNVWCKCDQGHNHQSRGEAARCNSLEILRKAKAIRSYKSQVKYELKCNGEHVTNHIVDFEVYPINGPKWAEDFKGGLMSAEWKIKKRLFELNFPDIEYRVVKK